MSKQIKWMDPIADPPKDNKLVYTIRNTWDDNEWTIAQERYEDKEWWWEDVSMRAPVAWTKDFPMPPDFTKTTTRQKNSKS